MTGHRRWEPTGIACPKCGGPTERRIDDDREFYERCRNCPDMRLEIDAPRPVASVRRIVVAGIRRERRFVKNWASIGRRVTRS